MKAIGPVSSSAVEDLLGEETSTTEDDPEATGTATSNSPSDEL